MRTWLREILIYSTVCAVVLAPVYVVAAIAALGMMFGIIYTFFGPAILLEELGRFAGVEIPSLIVYAFNSLCYGMLLWVMVKGVKRVRARRRTAHAAVSR